MNRWLILFPLAAGIAVQAADVPANAPATAASNATPALVSGNIEIFADRSEFDLRGNVAVYRGNVRALDPKMKLVCEQLTVKTPGRNEHIESIIAETNVVLDLTDEKGQKIHGVGDKAVYTYKATASATNETVELHGNALIESPQGSQAGDVITYDRITEKVSVTNARTVVYPGAVGNTNKTRAATNALPAGTNPAPAAGGPRNP